LESFGRRSLHVSVGIIMCKYLINIIL